MKWLISCCISTAFDNVNHKILLSKLINHQIVTYCFRRYLTNGTQSVKRRENISTKQFAFFWCSTRIYIKPNPVHNIALLFNTPVTHFLHSDSINKINEFKIRSQETLKQAKAYSHINDLKINSNRIQCFFICSPQTIAKIPMDATIEERERDCVCVCECENEGNSTGGKMGRERS